VWRRLFYSSVQPNPSPPRVSSGSGELATTTNTRVWANEGTGPLNGRARCSLQLQQVSTPLPHNVARELQTPVPSLLFSGHVHFFWRKPHQLLRHGSVGGKGPVTVPRKSRLQKRLTSQRATPVKQKLLRACTLASLSKHDILAVHLSTSLLFLYSR
jgi:hypothetical protein